MNTFMVLRFVALQLCLKVDDDVLEEVKELLVHDFNIFLLEDDQRLFNILDDQFKFILLVVVGHEILN